MALFALVHDDTICQIENMRFPVATGLTWVDITGISPPPKSGWKRVNGVFVDPAANAPKAPVLVTPLDFMARFTADETAAIHAAAMRDPTLFGWLLTLVAAHYVDLSDARTQAGLDALVQAGLLTSQRRTALVAG